MEEIPTELSILSEQSSVDLEDSLELIKKGLLDKVRADIAIFRKLLENPRAWKSFHEGCFISDCNAQFFALLIEVQVQVDYFGKDIQQNNIGESQFESKHLIKNFSCPEKVISEVVSLKYAIDDRTEKKETKQWEQFPIFNEKNNHGSFSLKQFEKATRLGKALEQEISKTQLKLPQVIELLSNQSQFSFGTSDRKNIKCDIGVGSDSAISFQEIGIDTIGREKTKKCQLKQTDGIYEIGIGPDGARQKESLSTSFKQIQTDWVVLVTNSILHPEEEKNMAKDKEINTKSPIINQKHSSSQTEIFLNPIEQIKKREKQLEFISNCYQMLVYPVKRHSIFQKDPSKISLKNVEFMLDNNFARGKSQKYYIEKCKSYSQQLYRKQLITYKLNQQIKALKKGNLLLKQQQAKFKQFHRFYRCISELKDIPIKKNKYRLRVYVRAIIFSIRSRNQAKKNKIEKIQ